MERVMGQAQLVVVKMSSGRIVTGAEVSALMKSGEKTVSWGFALEIPGDG